MACAADQHLESSTKRTLVENETMVAELAYHAAQVGYHCAYSVNSE
jgi:hypothetical protein